DRRDASADGGNAQRIRLPTSDRECLEPVDLSLLFVRSFTHGLAIPPCVTLFLFLPIGQSGFMMKVLRLALFCPLLAAMCWAQGTRTWEQTKYDEFEKGTSHGVAI